MKHYFKFQIPYKAINTILSRGQYKNIFFYIDLASITRGFYNKQVIELELANYFETQRLPTLFFDEANIFFNTLYNNFKHYFPKFITFFDSGECMQNKTIFKAYKGDRSRIIDAINLDDTEKELFKKIKNYYFEEFKTRFEIPHLSKVVYLDEWESDCIPHFIITNNIFNSASNQTLNIILTTDKDLLQTCAFNNVIQCSTVYKKSEGKIKFNVLYNDNAISYMYENFKRGILTAKHIPLILSLAGDKADHIPGIPGVGESTACKIVESINMDPIFYETSPLPQKYEKHRDLILKNYKLISFDEQLKRIPYSYLSELKMKLIGAQK